MEWKEEVKEIVEKSSIEDWKDGVARGKKYWVVSKVKTEWGLRNISRMVYSGVPCC